MRRARKPRLRPAAALAAAAALGFAAGGPGRAAAPDAQNVRFVGQRYYEAIGPGAAPPLTTTMTLDYRLSPSFADGSELRLFLGYAEGDRVWFHNASQGWQQFDVRNPAAPDFVSVRFSDPGVSYALEQITLGYPFLGFVVTRVSGVSPGGFVRFVIGDTSFGGPGYRMMRNESTARLLVQEKDPGASDWRLAWPEESFPTLTVGGVRADRFVLTAPSSAEPGATVELTIKPAQGPDDPYRSSPLVLHWQGTLDLSGSDPGMGLPSTWTMAAADRGRAVVPVTLPAAPGVYRVRASEAGNPAAAGESNPIVVGASLGPEERSPGLFWGSLHNHAIPSGHALETPRDAYRYARDYADLDFFALTDHCADAMSFGQFEWSELRELGRSFTAPGEFVAYSGYEWTSPAAGHRHVVFRRAELAPYAPCEMPSANNPLAVTLGDLEAQLSPYDAIAIPHHPAWRNARPMEWGATLDDPLRPLAEIYSWHGSSEAWDSRFPMHNDRAQQYPAGSGAWVQEALAAGHRFGFTGDSDNHKARAGSNNGATMPDGDPFAPGLFGRMGITGVYARDLSRDAIWEALRARRTIATTGARITGGFTVNGRFLGEAFTDPAPPRLRIRIHATDDLEEVVVFRDGAQIAFVDAPWTRDYAAEFVDTTVAPGEEHCWYVRAIQADGHHLWMSPIWMRRAP